MKKILAGILASTTLLAMTVSASAAAAPTDKTVTKPGEVTYDVAVAAPKVVLNLVMPAKMTAALNPYGAEIILDAGTDATDPSDDAKTTTGIASVAYGITNKSDKYGVWVDATAVTTVTTTDKTKWTVKELVTGTKSAALSLVAANTAADLATVAADLTTANYDKASDDSGTVKQGALKLDSTVAANKDTGIAAGQTNQKKFMFVPANDGTNDGQAYMAFLGDLQDDVDTIEWTEEDSINVNLVLKISAGAKTINGAAGGGAGGGSGWTATGTTAAATLSVAAGTFANTTGNNYTWSLPAADAASAGTVTPTLNLATGWTVKTAVKDSGRALTGTVNTSTGAFEIDNRAQAGDTGKVTITIEKSGETDQDIVIDITIT